MAEIKYRGETYKGREVASIVRRVFGRTAEIHSTERIGENLIMAEVVRPYHERNERGRGPRWTILGRITFKSE